jgi:hypothetical protein
VGDSCGDADARIVISISSGDAAQTDAFDSSCLTESKKEHNVMTAAAQCSVLEIYIYICIYIVLAMLCGLTCLILLVLQRTKTEDTQHHDSTGGTVFRGRG